jgi:hypothetical protein
MSAMAVGVNGHGVPKGSPIQGLQSPENKRPRLTCHAVPEGVEFETLERRIKEPVF